MRHCIFTTGLLHIVLQTVIYLTTAIYNLSLLHVLAYLQQQVRTCTTDQELALTTRFTRWQQFSVWSDVMAAILKLWCQVENWTPSIDANLREEHSDQISSWSHLRRCSLRLFHEMMSLLPSGNYDVIMEINWGTILPNLIPIWSEVAEPTVFWRSLQQLVGNKNKMSSSWSKNDDFEICILLLHNVYLCLQYHFLIQQHTLSVQFEIQYETI